MELKGKKDESSEKENQIDISWKIKEAIDNDV